MLVLAGPKRLGEPAGQIDPFMQHGEDDDARLVPDVENQVSVDAFETDIFDVCQGPSNPGIRPLREPLANRLNLEKILACLLTTPVFKSVVPNFFETPFGLAVESVRRHD